MRNLIFIFSFTLFLLTSCDQQDKSSGPKNINVSKTFKREIPTCKDRAGKSDTDYVFKAIRQDALDLGLDFIENGFDSIQLRIWLGHSMAKKRNVVVLKNTNNQWTAQLITYSYGYGKNERAFIKEMRTIVPRSGWINFSQRLVDLQILILPNGQHLKGYNSCGGADGIDYVFESATSAKYRFYYYCNPGENIDQFYEVKNVVEFSNVLEKEFGFTYTK